MSYLIRVTIVCLVFTQNAAMSDLCDIVDLRTVVMHFRQLESEYEAFTIEFKKGFAKAVQEQKEFEQKHINEILALQKQQNILHVDREYLHGLVAELQERQNGSETEIANQSIRDTKLEKQVSEAETQTSKQLIRVSELQDLFNQTDTNLENHIYEFKDLFNQTAADFAKQVDEFKKTLKKVKKETSEQNRLLDRFYQELNSTLEGKRNLSNNISEFNNTLQGTTKRVKDLHRLLNGSHNALQVRLVDGNNTSGRVEVSLDGYFWGTVCDDNFDGNDARVVCRMLGFQNTYRSMGNAVPDGIGQIFLDDLGCLGNESSLVYCTRLEWGSHNCWHNEDVGVSCS